MWEWTKLNPAVAVALIGIVGGITAAATKFLLDFLLAERLKRRWQTIEVKRKYSSPIIRSADDLAARIETLSIERDTAANWLRAVDDKDISQVPFERYFYVSTLYLIARLVCWIEILKKEQTYLEFTSTEETRLFNAYLNLIYASLSSPAFTSGKKEPSKFDYWIFFHYLSCIAEFMMRHEDNGTWTCISFHDFCLKYKESRETEFNIWMLQIEKLFVDLKSDEQDLRWRRIQVLWFCLDRFLEFVDPKELRTTRDRSRSREIGDKAKNAIKKRALRLGLSLE
jgi:hypothetical protein